MSHIPTLPVVPFTTHFFPPNPGSSLGSSAAFNCHVHLIFWNLVQFPSFLCLSWCGLFKQYRPAIFWNISPYGFIRLFPRGQIQLPHLWQEWSPETLSPLQGVHPGHSWQLVPGIALLTVAMWWGGFDCISRLERWLSFPLCGRQVLVRETDHLAQCGVFFFCFFVGFFWLHWVFVAACGLSLVAASRGCSSLWCAGFSLWWLLLLQSTASRLMGSVVVAHGLSCSAACRIFPDQGSNPCPLHWQADS